MNLLQRSLRSSAYNVGSSFIQTAIAFFRSIILLRLLPPEDFGTYRFLSSFIFWTAALPIFGMGGALIHRARESEGEGILRVHFTLTLFFNTLWVVVMGILGIFIIEDKEIYWLYLIILVSQFFFNLTQTARSSLIRKVAFRRIALLNTLTSILSTILIIILAWNGYGVWSLVSSNLIQAVIFVAGLYIIQPVWQPRLGWAKESVKYLLDFGRRNFLNQPLQRTLDRLDDIWAGFFMGSEALGFYSRAYRLASYPGTLIAGPLGSVSVGTYAELKEKPKRLSQVFFRVNAFLVRTGFLLGGCLTLIAPELIYIVAGEKWLPMVNTFRLMLIFSLLNPIKITVAGLFTAVGKPEIVTRSRMIQLGVLIVTLLAFGIPWGIEGVALAVDSMMLIGIGLLLRQAKEYVDFSPRVLFGYPSIALIASIAMAILATRVTGTTNSFWLNFIIKTIIFVICYLGLLLFFERDRTLIMVNLLKQVLPKQIGDLIKKK